MKKVMIALLIAVTGYACGGQDDGAKEGTENSNPAQSATPEPAAPQAPADITENPDYQKGIELIAQSDCLTCHKVEEKGIGPAYREVANKYANDDQTVTLLANKVIQGGKGVWGEVPMTPHPNLSLDDAKQMVKYVLLLKNK